MNPRVRTVRPRSGYKLEITFSSGEVGIFDCAPLLDYGVFRELVDVDYFRQVRVLGGTVVWPHEQDICPDTLYMDSKRHRRGTTTSRCTKWSVGRKKSGTRNAPDRSDATG